MKLFKEYSWFFVLLFFAAGIFTPSCKREHFDNSPGAKLSLSADTLLFDTVFTRLGPGPFPRSVNKRLIVHNRNKNTVKTTIRLAGGAASPFRINIDGERTTQVTDYEIMGNDSIYLFAEVSIDPNNLNNPLIVKDSIVFETNGNIQDVKLVAWGQDAYYFNDSVLACNAVWNDVTKPYVIYDSVLVPANCKLTIGPGVKVYSDVHSAILVLGTLEVNGTKDNRVIFQGARLGKDFTDIPGQWDGIHFYQASTNNTIKYADILNANIAIRSDSLPKNGNPKVVIENTLIKNMSAVGVLAFTSKINMTNCCVANCGQYTFGNDYGGTYEFRHCTFANYGGTFSRKDPSFIMGNTDYPIPGGATIPSPLTVTIANSIIYGSLREEIEIFRGGRGTFSPNFGKNILKTQILGWPQGTILNTDPKFKNINQLDFSLDTLSPAKDAALNSSEIFDLKGTLRDVLPDIGAYERVE